MGCAACNKQHSSNNRFGFSIDGPDEIVQQSEYQLRHAHSDQSSRFYYSSYQYIVIPSDKPKVVFRSDQKIKLEQIAHSSIMQRRMSHKLEQQQEKDEK